MKNLTHGHCQNFRILDQSGLVRFCCHFVILFNLGKFLLSHRGGCIGLQIDGFGLKITQIVDFCGESSGLADLRNTVDRGSAVFFGWDSGLRLPYVRILGPKRNLDHRSF